MLTVLEMLHRTGMKRWLDRRSRLARWAPSVAGLLLAAGLGILVQVETHGHVHLLGGQAERHHHPYVGEHAHGSGRLELDASRDAGDDPGSESGETQSQTGFVTAAVTARPAPAVAAGLPLSETAALLSPPATASPPALEIASEARPRAPPARLSFDDLSRAA